MTSVFDPGSDPVVKAVDGETIDCDIVIIGSGMGGSTLANAIRDSGGRVLVVERGDFLPREPANWSPAEVFQRLRYKNAEKWYDGTTGRAFGPGVHYYVGGNTKVYGACLPRFRAQDFQEIKHHGGISPAWPVSYADMEPFYGEAERMYEVHGEAGDDPTEPPRTTDFPFPALEHEPAIGVGRRLQRVVFEPQLDRDAVARRDPAVQPDPVGAGLGDRHHRGEARAGERHRLGRRFVGPDPDQVAPGQCWLNGLSLDGGGLDKAMLGEIAPKRSRKG